MQKPTLLYAGMQMNIRAIRNAILDQALTEADSLVLHPDNWDDIVIEHRHTYRESIPIPYYLLGVLIKEDISKNVPKNRVGVIRNDQSRYANDFREINERDEEDVYVDQIIYRCGWCGNIVDSDGSEFDVQTRQEKIRIHQKFRSVIKEKSVAGKCCPNGR